jgi:hypothetical protein
MIYKELRAQKREAFYILTDGLYQNNERKEILRSIND